MDLSLVLPRPGGFDGPPFPGESHIPALILGILKGCVIVLQYFLCEDTIPAPAVGLCEEDRKATFRLICIDIKHYDFLQHTTASIKTLLMGIF